MIKAIIYHLSKHNENEEVKACLEGQLLCVFFFPQQECGDEA